MKRLKKIGVVLAITFLLAAACVPTGGQDNGNSPTSVTDTPDVNIIVTQTLGALTEQASITQTSTPQGMPLSPTDTPTITVTSTPVPGSISGALSYPSEYIPALRVVAFALDGLSYRYVDTMENNGNYQITGLVPGIYHVVAYVMDGSLSGGYSQAVPCGLSFECTDHSLIDVTVEPGKDTPNINPADWYAPPGAFPPMP